MRVLIVGCGYVGQALGAVLAERGHLVWGVRRAGSCTELTALHIQPVVADVTEPASLKALPTTVDWVVYCVSSAGGGSEDYRRAYLEGSRNIVDWLSTLAPTKVVYTSSTSVYGQTDGGWVDETSVTEPALATGKILLETEQLWRRSGAVVLRVAGIYGPGRGYWLKQFLAGEARLQAAGKRYLNMVHRDDVGGAIIAALESGQTAEVYNLVDSEPVTEIELFAWLAKHLKRPLPAGEPADLSAKRGVTNKRVSNQRLLSELGYSLKYPTFREGYASLIGGQPE
jgi:nucleoside-diphosphate-sugar epimerase